MYIPLLEVEKPLFSLAAFVRAELPVFFFLRITVDTVEEYINFVIILRLPHLSTRAKLRKHKSNMLAALFVLMRSCIIVGECFFFLLLLLFLPRILLQLEKQSFSKHSRFQEAVLFFLPVRLLVVTVAKADFSS